MEVRHRSLLITLLVLEVTIVYCDDPRYMGCRHSSGWDFNEILMSPLHAGYGSVDRCLALCMEHRFTYAGLRGRFCRCYSRFIDHREDESKCTHPCPYNQTQTCGSQDQTWISVYTVCPSGFWGVTAPTCSFQCGQCAGGKQCDLVNGTCAEGCTAGYWGLFCARMCDNCNEGQCDSGDGKCLSGCKGGWSNDPWCNVCLYGSMGTTCPQLCGHCADGQKCNVTSGRCPGGCEAGYWGSDCRGVCGHCAGWSCDKLSGQCPTGCQDGWGNEPWCDAPIMTTTIAVPKPGEKSLPTYAIYVIVVVVIMSIVIAAGSICIILKRKRSKKKKVPTATLR